MLTNADIVTLTEAGLPPNVILAKIAATRTAFETSVAEIVGLSAIGVDADVIEAMIFVGTVAGVPGQEATSSPIDFGNDSSPSAWDGECNDPRFEGGGMASTLIDLNRGRDATDCRRLFDFGRIRLKGDQPIDFGNDSSPWARDGECDDPRFEGDGTASSLSDTDRGRDATDCRQLFDSGRIRLKGDQPIDFGDDSSPWARDGECDDPRFEGEGMASSLIDSNRGRDAADCRQLFDSGRIRPVGPL